LCSDNLVANFLDLLASRTSQGRDGTISEETFQSSIKILTELYILNKNLYKHMWYSRRRDFCPNDI